MLSAALFLDRDGVINIDHGYVYKREHFQFIDGVFELVRFAIKRKFLIIIITNQSGIGRGYYSEGEFLKLTKWMCHEFIINEAPITQVYYSPYHPAAAKSKYRKEHPSRKPNPGMILDAKADFGIDLNRSVLIGDKASDIAAGNAAGIGVNLLFDSKKDPQLNGLNYLHIANLHQANAYLNSGAEFGS